MKLVIEIPEKTIAHIRSDYGHGVKGLRDKDREIVCDAIYHGIPVREKIDNICHIVHSAILSVFESSEEERPFTKEELLLLSVNKAICTKIKEMSTTVELSSCILDEEASNALMDIILKEGEAE